MNKELREIFIFKIKTLSKLEKTLINFIENQNSSKNKKLFHELFHVFKKEQIYNDHYLYLEFLQIINYVSIGKSSKTINYINVKMIFHKLILKFKLKESFSEMTLFNTFEDNKIIILYLLKNDIINIRTLYQYLMARNKFSFVAFFFIELSNYNSKDFMRKIELRKVKKYILKYQNEIPMFENYREKGFPLSKIAQIIYNDDIENFINYIYSNNISIDSKLEEAISEQDKYINEKMSLIDYSIISGSLKIFKYLFKCKANLSMNSLKYSIISNQIEIFHILEENYTMDFDVSDLNISVDCHRDHFFNYIKMNYSVHPHKTEEFNYAVLSHNYIRMHIMMKSLKELCKVLSNRNFIDIILNSNSAFLLDYILKLAKKEVNMIINNFFKSYTESFFLFYVNPLYVASKHGNLEIAQLLLDNNIGNINAKRKVLIINLELLLLFK